MQIRRLANVSYRLCQLALLQNFYLIFIYKNKLAQVETLKLSLIKINYTKFVCAAIVFCARKRLMQI